MSLCGIGGLDGGPGSGISSRSPFQLCFDSFDSFCVNVRPSWNTSSLINNISTLLIYINT